MAFVPYQSGPAETWLADALKVVGHGAELLVAHLGVYDQKTPPFLQGASDSIHRDVLTQLMHASGIKACAVGNWHWHQQWATTRASVCQVGALAPVGFGDRGTGMMAIWDGTRFTSIADIPGPRFVKVDGLAALARAVASAHPACTTYVRALVAPDDLDAATALAVPPNVRVDLSVDATEARAEARTAATLARAAHTFDEALDGYMEALPVEAPATRQGVINRVRQYASKAR